ncbi:MAG: DNA alkylation repair protein [Rhodospirillales bacterium]|nr:DNA alkylation repair protein [Rhodospirillales bacterium]
MPEPFKNLMSLELIQGMAEQLSAQWPSFDQAAFVRSASHQLESLELKARAQQITGALARHLPGDFTHASDILLNSLAPAEGCDVNAAAPETTGLAGWAIMPLADYVALRGLGHFEVSLNLLKEMTKRFSAEFAIRPFLLAEPQRTMDVLKTWADDSNLHVRRLVSEGTRPRLPWAMRLPAFIADPAPVLRLLETLKDDDEEYVRRSVANNLNDIAKDHPDRIAAIAGQWLKGASKRGASKNRERLVRHACRTLIKQGHTQTLKALGYQAPKIVLDRLSIPCPQVKFGQALEFEVSFTSTDQKDQPLILDYAVHHRKANGGMSKKVFKWKTITLKAGAKLNVARRHAMRPITTRVYYPGTHRLEILANGKSLAGADFELLM